MKLDQAARTGLLLGALSGLVGGVIFAVTAWEMDRLGEIAQLFRASSPGAGFAVSLVAGTVIGAGFGVLVWYQRPGVGETLFWGLAYGVFWWYLGPLTLKPLLQGDGLHWDVPSAQSAFPLLLALVLYGAGTALTLLTLQWAGRVGTRVPNRVFFATPGGLARGMVAGLLAAVLLAVCLNSQDQLLNFASMSAGDSRVGAWFITLLIGLLAGGVYAVLYPNPTDGAGGALIRGTVYGFFWWVAAGLTVVPLLSGSGLTWSLGEVRQVSAALPGYFLFGAAVALFYQWIGSVLNILFSDHLGGEDNEGIGTQGLRIVGRSVVGGWLGGLIFSLIMLQTGFLPDVADLVGSSSKVAGFFVHLFIATMVGMSYGLLFRRHSYNISSALGWGVSYGFFWSILGPLTLMPVFLGGSPKWTIDSVAYAFPNLIGHLAFGVGLGLMFYFLEARYRPWWLTRTQAGAAVIANRKEQLMTSAPALWTLLVAVGLTLPVVIHR